MKKVTLLLTFIIIAVQALAQRPQPYAVPVDISAIHRDFMDKHMSPTIGARKTTAAPSRWYDYGIYMDLKTNFDRAVGTGSDYIYGYATPLWKDTFGIVATPSGPVYNTMVSLGNVLQPADSSFNRTDLFPCPPLMQLYTGDAYTVDSIALFGFYNYGSNAAPGVVDTLRLSFLVGNGTSSSSVFDVALAGGHYHSVITPDVTYDSTNYVAVGQTGGVPAQYMDVLLTSADTGYYNKSIVIRNASGALSPVNGYGGMVACVITFITGQPGIFTALPGDTLIGAVPPVTRYNMFLPIVNYYTLTDSALVTTTLPPPEWPYYNILDHGNTGLFKDIPDSFALDPFYIPTFGWSATSPDIRQYPEIAYHLVCPSCNLYPFCFEGLEEISTGNSITATPNPAIDELTISYSLTHPSAVTTTLFNMLGQQVASQKIGGVTVGNCVFNTAYLPPGIYIYTVITDQERSTGRVLVMH